MRRSVAWSYVGAAAIVASGCSTSDALEPAPVFAIDRDAAADIAPIDPERGVVVSAAELQILLQGLLTDHVTLTVDAMRLEIDGADRAAVLAELTTNTDALTGAMGLAYGPVGARAFDQLWTNHIEFFDDYAVAIRDGGARADVRDRLTHYEHDFSDFVSRATDGNLALETALHALHTHVDQLLDQADAWVAGDHAGSIESAAEAFDHAAAIAAALAASIAAQQPESFPGDLEAAASCLTRHLDARRLAIAASELVAAEKAEVGTWIDAAADELERATDSALVSVGGDAVGAVVDPLDPAGSDVTAARSEALRRAESFAASQCRLS